MKINKKLKGLVVAAIVCLAYMPIQAANYTCDVPEGQTMSVSDFGYTFKDGDKLIKTGKGVLTAVNNTTVAYDIDISNGVYKVAGVKQCGGADLYVRKGATLDITWKNSQIFSGDWKVYIAGDGAGTGDYLGAISLSGDGMNPVFGTSSAFYLSENATIYTYGLMNPILSGATATTGPTLYMNNRTLTLRGKDSTAVFRPRWKTVIDKPGPIVVRNGQFTRQKTTLACTANIPCITVTEGGSLQGFTDGANTIWNKVDAFVFDYGTKIIKGGNGEAANPMTLANVTGPVEISSDEKVTLKGVYTARGSDLAEGHVITSGTTLTFASGCKVKIDDICATAWTKGTPVTIATAMSIAGNPTIDPSQADLFTLTKTATEIKVTPTFDVVTLPTTTGYAFAVSNLTAGVEIPPAEAGGTTYLLPIGAKVGIYAVPEEGYVVTGDPLIIDEVKEDTTIDASTLPTAERGTPTGDETYVFVKDGDCTIFGTGKAESLPSGFDRNSITSVTVEDGITEIGARFFKNCTNMKSVTLGKNVVKFGEKAFCKCFSLETINVANEEALESLEGAVNYVLMYDENGKFVVAPKIKIAGYVEMLYGKAKLTDAEWTPIGKLSEQSLEKLKAAGTYHFFQARLEKVEE